MPIQQGTRSCPDCGAIVAIQVSEDDGATWKGPDNEERHAEWHRQQDARIDLIKAVVEAAAEDG